MRRALPLLAVVTAVVGCGADAVDSVPAAAVAVRASGCGPTPSEGNAALVTDELALTAAHVVAGATEIEILVSGDGTVTATVDVIDTAEDVAVLRLATPVSAGRVVVDRLDPIDAVVVGLPDRTIPAAVVRRVRIRTSDIYGEGEHVQSGYELRARVDPGDSGAGVLTPDGRLGGIVVAASTEVADRAWAVGPDSLVRVLDEADGVAAPAVPCR